MFRNILLFCIGVCSVTNVVYADASQFVFTTDPQSIPVNTLSGAITIQSQNNTGTQESVTETMDLVFSSNSASGLFLNSVGNAVSTTMSKNTANRTFYYKDSSAGTYTISVTITGRDTKKVFTVSQKINIGDSSTTPDQIASSTPPDAQSQSSSSSSTNTGQTASSHSSPVDVSSENQKKDFEISAGRDRFTSVGNDVLFDATVVKSGALPVQNVQYMWSFGDGGQALGKDVSHRYRFPGVYNVVLNASYSDFTAVSRALVSVIPAKISLSLVSGGVEIKNNSAGEVNLGDWVLQSGAVRFTIPKDTIVGLGKSIVFPQQISGISASSVVLLDPLGGELASAGFTPAPLVQVAVINSVTSTTDVISQNNTTHNVASIKPSYIKPKISVVSKNKNSLTGVNKTDSIASSTDNLATVYVGASKTNAFESVFNLPINGWNLIKHLFGR